MTQMNVYSIRLIPRLKIKFCEFLGVASSLGIRELTRRLEQFELRMDRFESQLRRLHRRQMALESAQKSLVSNKNQVRGKSKPKSKPKSKLKPVGDTLVRKTTRKVRSKLSQEEDRSGKVTRILTASKKIRREKVKRPEPESAIVLIQPDSEVKSAVENYFGKETRIISLGEVQALAETVNDKEVHGVFFDRSLLGNPAERKILEETSVSHPGIKFVGLSNYLTLALAQSVSNPGNFSTFLTKPLNAENLAGVFQKKSNLAISGRD